MFFKNTSCDPESPFLSVPSCLKRPTPRFLLFSKGISISPFLMIFLLIMNGNLADGVIVITAVIIMSWAMMKIDDDH